MLWAGQHRSLSQQNGQKKEHHKKYDKILCCIYCHRMIKHHIVDHLQSVHSEEHDVAKALSLPLKSMERKRAITLIKNKGNFAHNVKMIEEKNDNLILARRKSVGYVLDMKFLPCVFYKAFYATQELWRHSKVCPFKSSLVKPSQRVTTEATLMLESSCKKLSRMVFNF